MAQDLIPRPDGDSKTIQGDFKRFKDISYIYTSKYSNVYKAFDRTTGKSVVLKTINENAIDSIDSPMLRNEYRILSMISSAHVPKAIEYSLIGDGYYLAREYSDGVSLLEYLKGRSLSLREFVHIALQIVDAIADIHAAGVIHKDINPGNIIYDAATRKVSLIDFGIATEFSREMSPGWELNVPEASLWYISPEQTGRMNHVVDSRTDFYSLGVTFFEMLCDCHPFESESQEQIIFMHLAKSPPQVNAVNRSIPVMLSRIVAKLMAKMPTERYQNAAGIAHDLKRCLTFLDSGNGNGEFELGSGDYSGCFELQPKTYGRENEATLLEGAYARVTKGRKELVTIAGHSGIGKTTLVGELRQHLAGADDIFVYGKYDQYRQNIPFGAMTQALTQFCDFVFSESEKSVELWKIRIAAALKANGRLLIGQIPKLSLLAGDPDLIPELPPIEMRTRFRAALQELLAAVASPNRPLVMFFDDMHLADAGSFELIEEILGNERISGLLVIACYRDNEVNATHPLTICLNKMISRRMSVSPITLVGLAPQAACRLIADALRSDVDSVAELSAAIYDKTNGNPFYLRQFLQICHKKGYIRFYLVAKAWVWDIEAIKLCEAEENVVDFLIRNLDQMPAEIKGILSMGACVGRDFSVGILETLTGWPRDEILRALRQAVSLELVYSMGCGGIGEETGFRFSHDRFQQAFFTLLPEQERNGVYYRLARHFEGAGYGEDGASDRRFILADCYFKCFVALPARAEKFRALEILLAAAKAASLRSAFDTAVRYLRLITDSLTEIGADGEFAFAAYSEYHLALCSMPKYDEADAVYAKIQGLARDPIRLTDSCCLQAISLSNRGRYKDAFMLGVGLLGTLGVQFPAENLRDTILGQLDTFYSELGGSTFPGVEQLPKSDSLVEAAIAKLLNRISTAGLFYNAYCAFWAIMANAERVLMNGYTREGLPLYGSLTLLLIPFRNDYRLSYDLALGAMRLAERNGYRVYRMYHLFSLINSHWYEEWKTGIAYARESCRGNTSVGDFEFACFSYFTTQQLILETCSSVDELAEENRAALAYAERHGNLHAARSFVSFRQLTKAMIGTTAQPGSFDDGVFSEVAHLVEIASNPMAICFFNILRSLSAAVYMDFARAYELTESAIPHLPSITGFYATALHKFLHALSICKRIESERRGQEEEAPLLAKLDADQRWLGERAAEAPMNFMHLFDLINAERIAILGEPSDLISLYEKALSGAKENGRPWHYALACELAAQRFFALDAPMSAANFLREAYHSYGSWGAKGKVEQLRRQFIGYRLFDLEDTKRLSPMPTLSVGKTFDFNSLILASQAISRETRIEAVLSRLMNVLLENAGAQNAYYLTEENGAFSVMAECHVEGETFAVLQEQTAAGASIPARIVNYVARSRESIVLSNAVASEAYGGDEYISEHHCKSVLCMPILGKGELKGLLYLENNLIEGAFDEQRIGALNAIASQLAISLENAYLFDNLQQLVDERTRELRDEIAVRKDAEKRLEQMANCDMLTKLPNRRMFNCRLNQSIEYASQHDCALAVLFIDLDGFKAVNDKYGHEKGDAVLVATATRLLDAVRSGDTVSRLGGDEFVLILENVKSAGEIEKICGRIVSFVGKPIRFEDAGAEAVVTSSIGVSILRVDGMTAEELISRADFAMYAAKKNGKNRFMFYSRECAATAFPG